MPHNQDDAVTGPLGMPHDQDDAVTGLTALLDERERRRAAGFVDAGQRRRFVVAHGISRSILGDYLGVPPAGLGWQLGACGKPELAGSRLRVNLSHSGGLALLAVTESREIGVDVEQIRAGLPALALAERYYPPAEATQVLAASGLARVWTFLRLLTRKEACVKAAGARLLPALGLPVGSPPDPAGRGLLAGAGGRAGRWRVRDLPLTGDTVGAVALSGTEGFQILLRTWPNLY
jgi:4'-phosphopantetheinyl transferase